MVDPHRRNIAHAYHLRCLGTRMARDNSVGPIGQNWSEKSEFPDARRNLLDLSRRVRAWIVSPRLKLTGILVLNPQCRFGLLGY